jgi:hypothetical protein
VPVFAPDARLESFARPLKIVLRLKLFSIFSEIVLRLSKEPEALKHFYGLPLFMPHHYAPVTEGLKRYQH